MMGESRIVLAWLASLVDLKWPTTNVGHLAATLEACLEFMTFVYVLRSASQSGSTRLDLQANTTHNTQHITYYRVETVAGRPIIILIQTLFGMRIPMSLTMLFQFTSDKHLLAESSPAEMDEKKEKKANKVARLADLREPQGDAQMQQQQHRQHRCWLNLELLGGQQRDSMCCCQ